MAYSILVVNRVIPLPGYYPADEQYLVPGEQVLTCAQDGSGWQDQKGSLVDDIMRCRRGCIVRHKAPSDTGVDAKSVDKTYNLPDGLRVHCKYRKKRTAVGRLTPIVRRQCDAHENREVLGTGASLLLQGGGRE